MKHRETDTVYATVFKINRIVLVLKAFECDLTIDKTLGKHRFVSSVINLLKVEVVIFFQYSLSTFVKPIEPVEYRKSTD